MNSFTTIIDATFQTNKLQKFTATRPVAAIPIYGKYRLIDFALSSCYHSSCFSVGVFTSSPSRSLRDHVKSGKYWGLDRHRGGLYILSVDQKKQQQTALTFGDLFKHQEFLKKARSKYVVFLSGDVIIKTQLQDFIAQHSASKKEISQLEIKNKKTDVFIINREILLEAILSSPHLREQSLKDVIATQKVFSVNKIQDKATVYIPIHSLNQYYKTNMRFLDQTDTEMQQLTHNFLITKAYNLPPTKFLSASLVQNAIIINGTTINGHVQNSIVAHRVHVHKNSKITHSIISSYCDIGEGAVLDYVILDKGVKIAKNVTLKGSPEQLLFVEKNAHITN